MSTTISADGTVDVSVGIVRVAQRFNVAHDTSDDELVVVAREHVKSKMRHAQRSGSATPLLRDRARQRHAVKDAYQQLMAHRVTLQAHEDTRRALDERADVLADSGAQSARAQLYLSLRTMERSRFIEWCITLAALIVAVVATVVMVTAKYAPVDLFGSGSSKNVEITVYSPTGGIEAVDLARTQRHAEQIEEDDSRVVEVRDYHQFSIRVDDLERTERAVVDVTGTGIVGCRVTIDNTVISDKAEPSEVSCQATW